MPSPAGLVVKKGLNIFSFTSDEMPVPLSQIADFHAVAEVLRRGSEGWLITPRAYPAHCVWSPHRSRWRSDSAEPS